MNRFIKNECHRLGKPMIQSFLITNLAMMASIHVDADEIDPVYPVEEKVNENYDNNEEFVDKYKAYKPLPKLRELADFFIEKKKNNYQ